MPPAECPLIPAPAVEDKAPKATARITNVRFDLICVIQAIATFSNYVGTDSTNLTWINRLWPVTHRDFSRTGAG